MVIAEKEEGQYSLLFPPVFRLSPSPRMVAPTVRMYMHACTCICVYAHMYMCAHIDAPTQLIFSGNDFKDTPRGVFF